MWRDLSAALDRLADVAHDAPAPDEFHAALLALCRECLSAERAAVWQADSITGALRMVARAPQDAQWPTDVTAEYDAERTAALRATRPITHAGANEVLLLTALRAESQLPAAALLELHLPAQQGPQFYRGAEEFLIAVEEIAGEFYRRQELLTLRSEQQLQRRLLNLARAVDTTQNLADVSLRLVTEARQLLGCDRVSMVRVDMRRPQLVAASGVERVDRRAPSVLALERIAAACAKLREPIAWGAGHEQHVGPLEKLLDAYADQSHCRALVAAPLISVPSEDQRRATPKVTGVLVAENFGGDTLTLRPALVAEAADACRGAFDSTLAWEQAPLGTLVRAAHRSGWRRLASRTLLAGALLAALGVTLAVVPAPFQVDARGTLEPTVRQEVFAPVASVVDELLVDHGQEVKAGDELVRLRAPELALEISKLTGEIETLERRLQSLRATRAGLDSRTSTPVEAYRLSADEQQLTQELTGRNRELELLRSQQQALIVRSPIAGRVLTWQVAERLAGRAVERGQRLVSIADATKPWVIELAVPDDRIGAVLDAAAAKNEPLTVEFEPTSSPGAMLTGRIERIAATAEEASENPTERRTVRVTVTPDQPLDFDEQELLAGLTVRARIDCGERSLGYVWLHDVWNTLRTWWLF